VAYSSAEVRALTPVRETVEKLALLPERRDFFLCHAWDDPAGAAKELHDLLDSLRVSVWFSEKDVGLGTPLLREIDKGLAKSRVGIVLVTPALLRRLQGESIADKELSVLLARDQLIPIVHGTTYEALQRDPVLADRIKRLRTVPGVGPITALAWALEIGDVSRFGSIKKAISYCGLCGDERSSADKAMRMPLSKQRNKHIQRTLVEAAKLAPRQSHELAVIYDQERQKGNSNRATLAVARKMVAYLLAVDRQQRDFVPAEERRITAA
jgi:hypothetical protein